jgi:hypothetical protein
VGKGGRKRPFQTKAARLAAGNISQRKQSGMVSKVIDEVIQSKKGSKTKECENTVPQVQRVQRQAIQLEADGRVSRPLSFWVAIAEFPFLVLSVASNIVTVWGPFWPTAPDIAPNYPSAGSPFEIPFKFENSSRIFDFHDVNVGCNINHVRINPGSLKFDNNILRRIQAVEVEAHSVKTFICPFDRAFHVAIPGAYVSDATITFDYEYTWNWGVTTKRVQSKISYSLNTRVKPAQWEIVGSAM